jgi:apolipoprotein N-acyltransferase
MHEMKKKIIAKLVVQAVAVVFGALGLVWVGIGLHFVVSGIRDQDLFQMWYIPLIPLMFLLLGGYVITVAWWALRHFGTSGRKQFSMWPASSHSRSIQAYPCCYTPFGRQLWI